METHDGVGNFQVFIQSERREKAGRGARCCLREFERGGVQEMQRGCGE